MITDQHHIIDMEYDIMLYGYCINVYGVWVYQ